MPPLSEPGFEPLSPAQLRGLLHREPLPCDFPALKELIAGKRVLVTGAAGSIGSELCRQLLRLGAGELVFFDLDENGLFELGRSLEGDRDRWTLALGSVRDPARLEEVFDAHRPQLVFHAAAHKHVPMMELSPKEAVKNNVLGTLYTALAAIRQGAEEFLLISTDKAVNPTSVMGATKRVAEQIIQALDQGEQSTRLCGVRFGNVLGSSCSVVPIFRQQIAAGGPVTVTHREMERFFMTIPEAVELVLEAAALSRGGELFLLEMGQPVRIYDLACEMIRLAGKEPEKEIPIVFTGMRPGEKLREELALAGEIQLPTRNPRIYRHPPAPLDKADFWQQLERLADTLEQPGCDAALQQLAHMIPTFSHQ